MVKILNMSMINICTYAYLFVPVTTDVSNNNDADDVPHGELSETADDLAEPGP